MENFENNTNDTLSELTSDVKKLCKCCSLTHLGCSIRFFKKWINFQKHSGMTWKNYGTYWKLTFIREPCTYPIEEFDRALNWKNLAVIRVGKEISCTNRNYVAEMIQDLKVLFFKAHLDIEERIEDYSEVVSDTSSSI